jgi:hypothetical protein
MTERFMLTVTYAECCYAEFQYAECRGASNNSTKK